jgi:hypothetical protein
MIHTGHWFGSLGITAGVLIYFLPASLFAVLAAAAASLETKHTYPGSITPATFCRRFARVLPYLGLSAGMLPHQFSSFAEGLFGSLHSEFERTPKAGAATDTASCPPPGTSRAKIRRPYVLTEAFFVVYQFAWAALLAASGLVWCALGAAFMASSVLWLAFLDDDGLGRHRSFLDSRRRRMTRSARTPVTGAREARRLPAR